MQIVKANLRAALDRLDALGEGGGLVAASVNQALVAAGELPGIGDMTGFDELSLALLPEIAPAFNQPSIWPETIRR